MQVGFHINSYKLLAVLLAALPAPVVAQAQTYEAPNVPGQFSAMKHHGVAMGFHMGNAPIDPDMYNHWQGVARYQTPDRGIPYLFVTRNDATAGNLCVVQMPSRNRTGERFRSNRLERDNLVAFT